MPDKVDKPFISKAKSFGVGRTYAKPRPRGKKASVGNIFRSAMEKIPPWDRYTRLKDVLYQLSPWIFISAASLAFSVTKDAWVFGYLVGVVISEFIVYGLTILFRYLRMNKNISNEVVERPCWTQDMFPHPLDKSKVKCRKIGTTCIMYPLPSFDSEIGLPSSHAVLATMSLVYWALYTRFFGESGVTLEKATASRRAWLADFLGILGLTTLWAAILWQIHSSGCASGLQIFLSVILGILIGFGFFFLFNAIIEALGYNTNVSLGNLFSRTKHVKPQEKEEDKDEDEKEKEEQEEEDKE